MAKELLDKGFKDAAAVIVGSTLGGHLRQLVVKKCIPVLKGDGKPEVALLIDSVRAFMARHPA